MLKHVNLFSTHFWFVPSAKYDRDANKYWDRFYEMHHGKFFRNRSWLFTEFPELLPPDVINICSSEKSQDCSSSPPTCDSFPGHHADFRILEVLYIFLLPQNIIISDVLNH